MTYRVDRTEDKAQEIAEERYCRDFDELPKHVQYQVWSEAEQSVIDDLAMQADLRRDAAKERL